MTVGAIEDVPNEPTEPDVEYRGMVAETWDLFRGDTSGWPDRRFYLEAIERYGQPVLDVGCGTGRLLLDYRAQGIDVDGVDISEEMLALCRDRAEQAALAVHLHRQAMEDLDLPRRYRTIIVPSSSFQLLLDPPVAARAMARLHAHVEPGGALVMPFMRLWAPGSPLEESWTKEATRPSDGALIRRHSRSRFDPDTGLEHTEDRFEVFVEGELVASERHVRSPATRSYSVDEALALYRDAGFAPIEVFGEFEWSPAPPDARIVCVVGVRQPSK
jgi:ubiquinone/menaquinone biosynthesis C-methylase UbiE